MNAINEIKQTIDQFKNQKLIAKSINHYKFKLSCEINNELKYLLRLNLKEIKILSPHDVKSRTPKLRKFINKIKVHINEPGYVIINLDKKDQYNQSSKKKIYIIIGIMLGKLMKQNSKDEILINVRDKGRSLKEGARYHESNASGNLHTDSPQWKITPKIVGLLCLNEAKKGGDTILVDVRNLLAKIIKNKDNHLSNILLKFHFDKKRGDIKKKENLIRHMRRS